MCNYDSIVSDVVQSFTTQSIGFHLAFILISIITYVVQINALCQLLINNFLQIKTVWVHLNSRFTRDSSSFRIHIYFLNT